MSYNGNVSFCYFGNNMSLTLSFIIVMSFFVQCNIFMGSAEFFYLTDVYASEVSRLGEVSIADPLPVMSLHCKEGRRPAVFLRFRSVWIMRHHLTVLILLIGGLHLASYKIFSLLSECYMY